MKIKIDIKKIKINLSYVNFLSNHFDKNMSDDIFLKGNLESF